MFPREKLTLMYPVNFFHQGLDHFNNLLYFFHLFLLLPSILIYALFETFELSICHFDRREKSCNVNTKKGFLVSSLLEMT